MDAYRVRLVSAAALALGLLVACGGVDTSEQHDSTTTTGTTRAEATMPATTEISVLSSAFAEGAPIPQAYSCTGRNQPPPLTWTSPPQAARMALIMDDPDAVGGLFTHWVVSDIPPSTTGNQEGKVPEGGIVSANSMGRPAYMGPCPPAGTGVHHYRFTIHALARPVELSSDTPVDRARSTIEQPSIGYGRLIGTYAS